MSKICAELVKATELSTKRGEDQQDFLTRLIKAVTALSDKEWDGLSEASQAWFNSAVDAKNAKAKTLPDFPDAEKEDDKPARRGRGSKAEKEDPPAAKVGALVEIVTKRGKKITGKIVELDKEMMVIKTDDGEEEVALDRIESTNVFHGDAKPDADDEPADPVIKVGSEVKVVTKRGKEYVGKIVEMDDEVLVLKTDGGEEELARDRVETIKLVGGKAEKEEPKASGRRSSKAEDKGGDDDKGGDEKAKRSSNNGVSVGTRIKEIIADDIEATEADVAKILKKEGLEFRENTLKLNYVDCHKFLDVLKAKKLLKL